MTRLLDEDCIPEKHVILDEAMKRADAPQAPNNYIVFGKDEFKKNFKNYFELVAKLAKQMRRQVMGSIGIP